MAKFTVYGHKVPEREVGMNDVRLTDLEQQQVKTTEAVVVYETDSVEEAGQILKLDGFTGRNGEWIPVTSVRQNDPAAGEELVRWLAANKSETTTASTVTKPGPVEKDALSKNEV